MAMADSAEAAPMAAVAESAMDDEMAEEEGAADSDGESIRVRLNFDPLALFAPDVRTGQDGRASVELTLPDNLTRYRVMVVAGFRGSAIRCRRSESHRASAPDGAALRAPLPQLRR